MGVVWGHIEGNLGVLWVVPWGHFGFGGTLGMTLGVLWDYFEGILVLLRGFFWGYARDTLKVSWDYFEGTLGSLW